MADALASGDKDSCISTSNIHYSMLFGNQTSESGCKMTQKQEENEPDCFEIADLFVNNPDDLLPPLAKLEKYANCDIVLNRLLVVRDLLETLRTVVGNEEEVARVFSVVCNLAEDYEPSVRSELIEQVPHIARFCSENAHLRDVVQHLVPIIIKYLTDVNNQVRKTTQASLILMVEQCLIDKALLEEKIFSLIFQLTESSNLDDHRAEAITLMNRLSSLLGKEITERLFLQRFLLLCHDSSFHVRKVCASSFGDMCTLLEQEITEQHLLSEFFTLCQDSVWGVRKACAEVFMPVSCVCSMETRRNKLMINYLCLLCDQSRWVRLAAYQGLGPFISTFADPELSGLHYGEDGVLIVAEASSNSISENIVISESTNEKDVKLDPDSPCDTVAIRNDSHLSDTKKCKSSDITDCEISTNGDVFESDELRNDVAYLCTENIEEVNISEPTFNNIIVLNTKKAIDNCIQNNVTVNGISVSFNGSSFETQPTIIEITDNIEVLQSAQINSSEVCNNTSNCESQCNSHQLHISYAHLKVNEHENCINFNNNNNNSNTAENILPNCVSTLPVNCENSEAEKVLHKVIPGISVNIVGNESSVCLSPDSESAFNTFQFWRMPLPDIELEIDDKPPEAFEANSCDLSCYRRFFQECIGNQYCDTTGCSEERSRHIEEHMQALCLNSVPSSVSSLQTNQVNLSAHENSSLNFKLATAVSVNEESSTDVLASTLCKDGEPPPSHSEASCSIYEQQIVPAELLMHYFSMTDPIVADTVDAELARHCAYSLPAVALTLGRKYWPCLRETCNTLASDMQGFIMQWKVRRTLASSMHQLAAILGPDITALDLLPIFSGFIGDLDEVRIGILQNLSKFLEVLRPKKRREYLPRLSEFLTPDNDRNWRFRLTFAEQLILISDLYDEFDIKDYLVPLTMALIRDKICEVRLVAVRVMAVMVRQISQSPSSSAMTKTVLSELAENFVHARKWMHRQIYVYLSQEFVKESSLPLDQFAENVMPHLLYLCWDRVANVRLAIARCLATVMWPSEFFSGSGNPHRELLLEVIHTLQDDVDADVQYYANMVATNERSFLQHKMLPKLVLQSLNLE